MQHITTSQTKFSHCILYGIRHNKFIHCLNLYLATLSVTCSFGVYTDNQLYQLYHVHMSGTVSEVIKGERNTSLPEYLDHSQLFVYRF